MIIFLRRLLPFIALAFALNAHAQNANMAYVLDPGATVGQPVPSSWMGTWAVATDDSLVLVGRPGQTYAQGVVARFGDVKDAPDANIYACRVSVPAGQRDGCPTPGVYTEETYIPHWQVRRVNNPPPCYGTTTRCSKLLFGSGATSEGRAYCGKLWANHGTSTRPDWKLHCTCANPSKAIAAKWAEWKQSLNATKTVRDQLYRANFYRGLSEEELAVCRSIDVGPKPQ